MDSTSIIRVLFLTPIVHVYAIPPLTSTKGFNASSWTAPPRPTAQHIFTARLRILENSSASTKLSVTIQLEDQNTGDLFAAAPYTSAAVVQSAQDSSRFFAVRVQGEGGMKATLGLGFEDRSPAFDFGIALGEARKVLGWDASARQGSGKAGMLEAESKRDFSLKKGEKIVINVGGKGRREQKLEKEGGNDQGQALFSIPPPPPAGGAATAKVQGFPAPPPPPAAGPDGRSAQDLGFDDGEFGEFQ